MIGPDIHQHGPVTEPRPAWSRAIEALDLASLIIVIERRLGARGARCDPEDILQEALCRSWVAWERTTWMGYRAARSWFLTIVDHCIADSSDKDRALKRGGGATPIAYAEIRDPSGAPMPADSSTPSRVACRREHAAVIRDALLLLPVEHREAVYLRVFEQRAVAEIAESLGVTAATARRLVRVGCDQFQRQVRRRLREGLGTDGSQPISGPSTTGAGFVP